MRRAGEAIWHNDSDWEIVSAPLPGTGRRGAGLGVTRGGLSDLPPGIAASEKVRVAGVFVASPKAQARRGGGGPQLDLSVPLGPDEGSVVALRRQYVDPRTGKTLQGAITFHRAVEHEMAAARRGTR